MDAIQKALNRLTPQERKRVAQILILIRSGNFQHLDVQKLKGRNDIYRVRKDEIRIIYRIAPDGDVFVLTIERRSEHTYKKF